MLYSIGHPPASPRTDTPVPYTTLFRSRRGRRAAAVVQASASRNRRSRVRRQRASRIVASRLIHRIDLAVSDIGGHMAAAIVETRAEGERRVEGAAIGRHAARIAITARVERNGELALVAVIVVVQRILRVGLVALEVGVHHEVDDADRKSTRLNSS